MARMLLEMPWRRRLTSGHASIALFFFFVGFVSASPEIPGTRLSSGNDDSLSSPFSEDEVNVALHRPCEPDPVCHVLIDGSLEVVKGPSQRRGRNGVPNNTELAADDASGQAPIETSLLLGADNPKTFKVFLESQVLITKIIIFFKPMYSGNFSAGGLRRWKVLVTTWMYRDLANGTGNDAGNGSNSSLPTTWERDENEVEIDPAQIVDDSLRGLKLELAVNKAGLAAAVVWKMPSADYHDAEIMEPQDNMMQITEVAVMALALSRYPETTTFTSTVGMHRPTLGKAAATNSNLEELPTPKTATPWKLRTTRFPQRNDRMLSTLSTTNAVAQEVRFSSDSDFVGPMADALLPPSALALFPPEVCVALTLLLLLSVAIAGQFCHWSVKWAGDGGYYERLPEADPEAPSLSHASTMRAWLRYSSGVDDVVEADPNAHKVEDCILDNSPVLGRREGSIGSGLSSSPEVAAAPCRVVMLYASPLCHRDPTQGLTTLAQIPFRSEWDLINQAHQQAIAAVREKGSRRASSHPSLRQPRIALEAQPLTAASLQHMIAPVTAVGSSTILHLSAHGHGNCLVLEDGRATAHLLDCERIDDMLQLCSSQSAGEHHGLRLVVLNSCSLRSMGVQFAKGGVPHVICSSADLLDNASQVFMRTFYRHLFQGDTVARAFGASLVALRSDPVASTRDSVSHFCLLPESDLHEDVLCPLASHETVGTTFVGANDLLLDDRSSGRGDRLQLCKQAVQGAADRKNHLRFERFRMRADLTASIPQQQASCASGAESSSSNGREEGSDDNEDTGLLRSSVHVSSCSRMDTEHHRLSSPLTRRKSQPLDTPVDHLIEEQVTHTRGVAASKLLVDGYGASGGLGISFKPYSYLRRKTADVLVPREACSLFSPLKLAVPEAPEDFVGRAFDVWSVLQHLISRRVVIVCGAPGMTHGVGKSAVLDAVHRSFVHQMGGMCVATQLRCLQEPGGVISGGWVTKLSAAVRATLQMQCAGTSRRRILHLARGKRHHERSHVGAGHLDAPDCLEAIGVDFEELIAELNALDKMCQARSQQSPGAVHRILIVLDECDHLIQQGHFQAALADILQRCSSLSIVVSTHQRMVGTAGGQFKFVHHAVDGLAPRDAARLFLRRSQRPLRWGELAAALPMCKPPSRHEALFKMFSARSPVVLSRSNEGELLDLVAAHPSVAAQLRNPRQVIDLASRLSPSIENIVDLTPSLRSPTVCPTEATLHSSHAINGIDPVSPATPLTRSAATSSALCGTSTFIHRFASTVTPSGPEAALEETTPLLNAPRSSDSPDDCS